MNPVIEEVLQNSASQALEEWAMLLVDSVEARAELFESDEKLYLGQMQFEGVMNGLVVIICGHELLEQVCGNVLGLGFGEEVSEAELLDALRELTNVLTGHFLTEAYGDDVVFDIVAPKTQSVGVETLEKVLAIKPCRCFLGDDNPVLVAIAPLGSV